MMSANMTPRFFFLLALSAALLQPSFARAEAAAEPVQPFSPSDSRIKLLMYDPNDVYVIRAKYGYQTNIVLAPEEEIQTISVGDRSLWQIIPAGNRLYIRPMDENITTNMTLITNRRSYEFDLKSVAQNNENNIYVARFVYPPKGGVPEARINDNFSPASSAAAAPLPSRAPENPEHVLKPPAGTPVANPAPADMRPVHPNYNYTYSGPDALAPLQVYDDGRYTYVKYRQLTSPFPSAYTIGPGGQEYAASYRVEDSTLILEGVAAETRLRSAGGVIKIYNELLNPQ
jgi:type IV secretion system protein VirB9